MQINPQYFVQGTDLLISTIFNNGTIQISAVLLIIGIFVKFFGILIEDHTLISEDKAGNKYFWGSLFLIMAILLPLVLFNVSTNTKNYFERIPITILFLAQYFIISFLGHIYERKKSLISDEEKEFYKNKFSRQKIAELEIRTKTPYFYQLSVLFQKIVLLPLCAIVKIEFQTNDIIIIGIINLGLFLKIIELSPDIATILFGSLPFIGTLTLLAVDYGLQNSKYPLVEISIDNKIINGKVINKDKTFVTILEKKSNKKLHLSIDKITSIIEY